MAKLSLKKFLPPPPVDRTGFQTRVDTALLHEANEARKEDGISWQDLQEALLKMYLENRKKEKSNA